MKLDLQLTTQSKLLLGVLLLVLIIAVATQLGPGIYGMIANPDIKTKELELQKSKDLVYASKILKPIESDLYQKTGIADGGKTTSIFEENFPETVIREKINGIIKQAGIPQNYQMNMEPVPGRRSEKISPQARRNLVVFLYQRHLESERDAIKTETESAQQDTQALDESEYDDESMGMLLNAWLEEEGEGEEKEVDKEKPDENRDESEEPSDDKDKADVDKEEVSEDSDDNKTDTENKEMEPEEWKYVSLPKSIPGSIRIELIDLILSISEQHLVGAEKALFANEFLKKQTEASSGFFGIGAKEATTAYDFQRDSKILAKFTNLLDNHSEVLNKKNLVSDLLAYFSTIQKQVSELTDKLELAQTSYTPESFTIKIKFTTEIDKLVNLNRLIETKSRWLMVRDLQISADNKDNKILVEVLLIARVYQ